MTRVAMLAPLVAGCFGHVFHMAHDAPGEGSVRSPPPATLGIGQRVRPEDPGEQMISVAPEVTFGGGVWQGDWSLVSSAEIGAWYGERGISHESDSIVSGDMRVIPLWSVGGAVGYDLVPLGSADRRFTLAARITQDGIGTEAGWGFEPTSKEHSGFVGFYLSSWSRFFYLRAVWGPDRGLGAEMGIAADYALTWVWSQ